MEYIDFDKNEEELIKMYGEMLDIALDNMLKASSLQNFRAGLMAEFKAADPEDKLDFATFWKGLNDGYDMENDETKNIKENKGDIKSFFKLALQIALISGGILIIRYCFNET